MVSIIAKTLVTKPALHITRLIFMRKGIVVQMMVMAMDGMLVVFKIIKAPGTTKRKKFAVTNTACFNKNVVY